MQIFFFFPKKTDLKEHKHLETVTQKRELHRNKTLVIVLRKTFPELIRVGKQEKTYIK